MTKVTSLPDNVEFDVAAGETVLEAGLRTGIAFVHACRGRAKCSTCRVWVVEGIDAYPARTEFEASMATRLGLTPEVRFACQLKPRGPLRIRRLVIDETDLLMCSQHARAVAARAGEAKKVTIVFSDINNLTSLAERLSAYDVMYLHNRYFVQAGDIIEQNGGCRQVHRRWTDGDLRCRRTRRCAPPRRAGSLADDCSRGPDEAVLRLHVRRRLRYPNRPPRWWGGSWIVGIDWPRTADRDRRCRECCQSGRNRQQGRQDSPANVEHAVSRGENLHRDHRLRPSAAARYQRTDDPTYTGRPALRIPSRRFSSISGFLKGRIRRRRSIEKVGAILMSSAQAARLSAILPRWP